MKKNVVFILTVILVVGVLLVAIFVGDKPLDLKDKQITNLYSYLGDVNRCGGLIVYTGDEVTYDALSSENKLCMAYYKLDAQTIQKDISNVTTTNDNDIAICEVGEGIRLAASEGEDSCSYQVLDQEILANTYRTIYGQDIPKDKSFYINSTQACYLEGDTYYCGDAETFVVSLAPDATIYRLLKKAVQKMNGDIVIQDYYLRVSGNACYSSNSSDGEITSCTDALKDNENIGIDSVFVQEYASVYEHTFKKDSDGNYYWYSSNLK